MIICLLIRICVVIRVFRRAILLMMVNVCYLSNFRGITLAQEVVCTCGLRLALLLRLLRRLLLIRLLRRLLRRPLRLLLLLRRIRLLLARLGRFARHGRRLRHSAWVNARRTRFPDRAIWC